MRVLGPLEVETVTGVLRLAPLQRTLVAMLVAHRGHVVSTERLVAGLWGEVPPQSARNRVQALVSSLRRQVTPDALIETRSTGYSVRADPERLDVARFERLVGDGRRRAAGGDVAGAAEMLREALGWWRGDAFDDVDCPYVTAEAARLNELRQTVTEELIDARLALGERADLVAQLSGLVAAEPFRERLRGQLMLALHRSGRTADALEVYREGAETAVEAYGLDPGEGLQRLRHAILVDDPRLTAPDAPTSKLVADVARSRPSDPVTVHDETGPPRQLPAAAATFVGRTAELAALLAAGAPVRVVHGPPGVGKSTLALRLAHALAPAYPDGQLYLDMQGSSPRLAELTVSQALGRFLRAMGVPDGHVPADSAEAAARYRSLLSGRRMLIMLDNAVDAAQIRELLPGTGDSAVLVTSRRGLTALDGAYHLALDVLPHTDAVALLAGVAGLDRIRSRHPATDEIVARCGRLPLAIRIAAARLAARPDWSPADLAHRLADEWHRLDELNTDDLAVRSCFHASYRVLDPAAARTFRLAGLLRVPELSVPAVAALVGEPLSVATAALDRLAEAHLVEPVAGSRYRLHDLLRLYAAECAAAEEPPTERDAALHRALVYYFNSARRAVYVLSGLERPIDPDLKEGAELVVLANGPDASRWLASEWTSTLAVADHAVELAGPGRRYPAQLLRATGHYLIRRAEWREIKRLAHLALAAAHPEDLTSPAIALGLLVQLYMRAGQWAQAIDSMQRAIGLWQRVDDLDGLATAWNIAGNLARRHGDPEEALRWYQQSLAAIRQLGNRQIEALVLVNVSIAYTHLGQYREALEYLRKCFVLPQWGDTGIRNMVALLQLGRLNAELGELGTALRYLSRALPRAAELGDSETETEALLCRSEVFQRLDRPDRALVDAVRAHEACTNIADRYGQAVAQRQIGKALASMGRMAEASERFRQAKRLFTEHGPHHDPILESFLTGADTTLPRPPRVSPAR